MKTRAILGILCILLAATVLVVYKAAFRAYDRYNDLRLNPIGMDDKTKFEFEEKDYELVLLGDSHAANWRPSFADVLNLGIPSQTSNQVLLRSNMLADKLHGHSLVIMTGANDIKSILTNRAEKEAIVSKCAGNIKKIAANHTSRFHNVFVMTVPPVFTIPREYWPLYDKSISDALLSLNNEIRDFCKTDSAVYLLDAYAILNEKRKKEKLSADGIHMNTAGYVYPDNMLHEELNKRKAGRDGE
jgi:lysophospholipase L1-like esterase